MIGAGEFSRDEWQQQLFSILQYFRENYASTFRANQADNEE